jgi:hypothetical protein
MAILPVLGAAGFQPGAPFDNPFFPLERGSIRSYEGRQVDPGTGEVGTERNDLFATFESHQVFGVDTTVIRDTVYANGALAEETLDWYAQDAAGNLWYSARSRSISSMRTPTTSSARTMRAPGKPGSTTPCRAWRCRPTPALARPTLWSTPSALPRTRASWWAWMRPSPSTAAASTACLKSWTARFSARRCRAQILRARRCWPWHRI